MFPPRDIHYQRVRVVALGFLLVICFLGGGASRVDVASLLYVQPLAVIATAAVLLTPGPIDWAAVRVPLLLLAALGATIAAQLVPLPPAVWVHLPGHQPFSQSSVAAGLPFPWRPIALSPDLAMASLVGLCVPFSVLVGLASLAPRHRRFVLPLLLAGIVFSSILALMQIAGGPSSPAYLYHITNDKSGVGVFANRNHQACLLALAFPMLAVWATLGDGHAKLFRLASGFAFSLFLVPLILVTGSRAGLILGAMGIAFALLFWRRQLNRSPLPRGRKRTTILLVAGISFALTLAAAFALSRDQALERVTASSPIDDLRFESLGVLVRILRDFFPVGTGFGSFDPVFRAYEPISMLRPEYFNHAHDDWLELVMTGGLPAAIVGLLFLGWLGWAAKRAWRSADQTVELALARLGSAMALLLILSSLLDYPLRTPLMAAILAIATSWLNFGTQSRESPGARERGFTSSAGDVRGPLR